MGLNMIALFVPYMLRNSWNNIIKLKRESCGVAVHGCKWPNRGNNWKPKLHICPRYFSISSSLCVRLRGTENLNIKQLMSNLENNITS